MDKELLVQIGFDLEDLADYNNYKKIIGDKFKKYAEDFCVKGIDFNATLIKAKESITSNINGFTLDLMFVLECLPFVEKIYEQKNYPKSIFIDSMKDIKCKINECRKIHGVFGTFVAEWYVGFFKPYRFGLGRLQFNDWIYADDNLEINGFTLAKGDFVTLCHVPSSGKLNYEDCIDSYKQAYKFFKHKLKNGILPVIIDSWLSYPPYRSVFGEDSNITKFAKDFTIFNVINHEDFYDGWRVFGQDYNKECIGLPNNTSLQRKFIAYIQNGGTFGVAKGILLFDGNKIIVN